MDEIIHNDIMLNDYRGHHASWSFALQIDCPPGKISMVEEWDARWQHEALKILEDDAVHFERLLMLDASSSWENHSTDWKTNFAKFGDGSERKQSWVAVLCMERAFKADLVSLRETLEILGALVLCYKQVEQCLEWNCALPNGLKLAPCMLLFDVRNKHVVRLLALLSASDEEKKIGTCLCVLQNENAVEILKVRRWALKMQPRLPFPLHVAFETGQTINLILETIRNFQHHQHLGSHLI